jgi:hypothetical protein
MPIGSSSWSKLGRTGGQRAFKLAQLPAELVTAIFDSRIAAVHEPLNALLPAYGCLGAITDDTQMTLFTAKGLLRAWVRGTYAVLVSVGEDAG